MTDWLSNFAGYLPAAVAALLVLPALGLAHWLLLGRKPLGAEARLPRQLIMLGLTIICVLLVVLLLPMTEGTRGQVLSLLGIVFTGVLGISSTTFVANAMGGLMLRTVNSFRPGDFVQVGEQFGRVTERGLFHTEIQTENRDLATLPNLYLVTNPVTVVHASGTMISTSLSLGYDVSHERVIELLKKAAADAGLSDPFVHVQELGDFSITYRVAGFSEDAKHLLTARSSLRCSVLDVLHAAGIEIVSPSFMNQRRLAEDVLVIPEAESYRRGPAKARPEEPAPESLIFDKAEEAGERESRREELEAMSAGREKLREAIRAADDAARPALERQLTELDQRIEVLARQLEAEEAAAEAAENGAK